MNGGEEKEVKNAPEKKEMLNKSKVTYVMNATVTADYEYGFL